MRKKTIYGWKRSRIYPRRQEPLLRNQKGIFRFIQNILSQEGETGTKSGGAFLAFFMGGSSKEGK
ncbi:MAG: hypothetical protein B5M55_08185 [Desulfococcus sp. 4484_242]|nr:MAG: hypothetical protein B5M55_08185 [Desulfococcus sp. 4484_242]